MILCGNKPSICLLWKLVNMGMENDIEWHVNSARKLRKFSGLSEILPELSLLSSEVQGNLRLGS